MKFNQKIFQFSLCFLTSAALADPFKVDEEFYPDFGSLTTAPIGDFIFLISSVAAYYYFLSSYAEWKRRKLTNEAPKAMNGAADWIPAIIGYLIVAIFISLPILLITKWVSSASFVRDIWYLVYAPSFLLLMYFRRNGAVNESRSSLISSANVKVDPTANVVNSNPKSYPVSMWYGLTGIVILVVLTLSLSPSNAPHEAESIPQQQSPAASTPSQESTSNSSEFDALPSEPAVSSQAPSDVNESYTQMQALYNDRRYVDLAVFVQNYLIQNPKDYLALNYGGLAFHAMGDMDGARLRYKNAIALMPKDPTLYYNLASTYNASTEYQTIIRILKTAQKNDPDNQLINDSLKAMRPIAQQMEAERQAEARYMKQSRLNVSNDDEPDCEVKPVMTDEELQHWRTCQPKVR